MLAARAELKNAQKVKEFLLKHQLLNPNCQLVKEFDYIYFPLSRKAKVPAASVVNTKFSFPGKEKPLTVEEILGQKLTPSEREILPKSQEVVGKILLLEIPPELQKKERLIAEAYLKANKNVETVVRKEEIHSGEYRLRKVKVLAGKNNKETVHHENGVEIKLHLEKTYFSARLANERLRIARLVKKGEEVLVMFSGAAPYPLVLARNSPVGKVYGIEINPLAHNYAVENVALNHLESKIIIYEGDVRQVLLALPKRFDRIVMPLPKTGKEFLDIALPKVKKGGLIHLYAFLEEKDFEPYADYIQKTCRKLQHPVKILRKVKCGRFSPGTFRVCLDMKVME